MSCDATDPLRTGHPLSHGLPARKMAKARPPNRGTEDLEADEQAQREAHGAVLRTVQHVLGKSRKEMAAILGIDERRLGHWYEGRESAQVWRYHRHPKLREVYRLIDALDDTNATVEVQITSKLDLEVGEKRHA